MRVYDGNFEYRDALKRTSMCRLRVWRRSPCSVVIATELDDNPGPSVTNSSEDLAAAATRRFDLDPKATTWIEHYLGDKGTSPSDFNGEHYDLVTYIQRFDNGKAVFLTPQWRRIPADEVEKMVGEKL